MSASRPAADAGGRVDSHWWYVVAVTPLYAGTVVTFVGGLSAAALLGESTDFATFLPAVLALALLAVPIGVAFPLALYRDAAALRDAAPDWNPSAERYAFAGVVGVVTGFVGTIPLAVYYLYRRHVHFGEP